MTSGISGRRRFPAFTSAVNFNNAIEFHFAKGTPCVVVARRPAGVWIFELKVDDTAEHALEQIRRRDYLSAYLADGRPVYAIGLSFDSKTRQLADLVAEEIRR